MGCGVVSFRSRRSDTDFSELLGDGLLGCVPDKSIPFVDTAMEVELRMLVSVMTDDELSAAINTVISALGS